MIESRKRRLVAYLRHDWSLMVVDVVIPAVWLIVTTAAFQWFALPGWLLYVVFVGAVIYARTIPGGRRPYRSPEWTTTVIGRVRVS